MRSVTSILLVMLLLPVMGGSGVAYEQVSVSTKADTEATGDAVLLALRFEPDEDIDSERATSVKAPKKHKRHKTHRKKKNRKTRKASEIYKKKTYANSGDYARKDDSVHGDYNYERDKEEFEDKYGD